MKILKKVYKEIKIVARTALYFAIVYVLLMIMKTLDLKDYNIEFNGITQAILGALVMSKVIILMELIILGPWVQRQPPFVDIILRTFLYTAGVLAAILLEKAFEQRHSVNGFGNAIGYVFSHRDIYHVWSTIIGSAAAILVYNTFSVLQRYLGKNKLAKLIFSTPLNMVEHKKTGNLSGLSTS
jgi:hypothetical protein